MFPVAAAPFKPPPAKRRTPVATSCVLFNLSHNLATLMSRKWQHLVTFAFLWWPVLLSIFSHACGPLCIYRKNVHQILFPFRTGLLFVAGLHSSCILNISPYEIHDLHIVYPISWVAFLLLTVSFDVQKFLILMMSNLSIFGLLLVFWCRLQEVITKTNAMKVFPFSSQISIALPLKFRSLMHFEFIFVYDVR